MSIDINDLIAVGIVVCIGILILYGIYAERGQREEDLSIEDEELASTEGSDEDRYPHPGEAGE